MVAPGDPALAVQLAEKAAKVSHDGEAVYAAQVVAAMVSEAFVSNDMEHLLDTALSFIPAGSLIAQIHRDVRAWVKEDGDWEKADQLFEEKLKQFMSESDSKISSIRQYSDHRTKSRRR